MAPEQKLYAEIYIFNLGNLINHNWGTQFSPNFFQTYTAINSAIVGNQYQYSAFTTPRAIATNITNNRGPSTYQIAFSIKYDF